MTRNILVVDDEPNYRALVDMQLSNDTNRVSCASGGSQALEILRAQKIDLLITDMKMPRMDGLDVLIEARKITPDIPTIIITGYSVEDRLRTALEMTKTNYLAKPFDIEDLEKMVAEMCPAA